MNQRTVDFGPNASGTGLPAPHCGQTEASPLKCSAQRGQATEGIGIPRFPVSEPTDAGHHGPKSA